jgi:DNA helicase-2/ATP-dependent DNA helicase PcrA
MIRSFMISAQNKDAFEAASHIAKNSGLLRELYEDKTVEGLNRYENVQELLNAIKEYVDNPEVTEKSLGAFLQEIALVTDNDNDKKNNEEAVTLMTIHAAKGLEFKYVFIVGMEEDLFPSQMMLSSRADLEEERRLFYVALTRAEKRVYLTYALNRYRFGRLKTCEPSRFIEEIDPRFIRVNRTATPREAAGNGNYARNLVNGISKEPKRNFVQRTNYQPSTDFAPSDTSELVEGMKVEHPKFGFGTVTEMDIQGSQRKARVTFEEVGEKTLLLAFAKLKIHH